MLWVVIACVLHYIKNKDPQVALWETGKRTRLLRLYTRMLPSVIVVLTGDGSGAFGSALSDRLQSIGGGSEIRSSGVMESWDGLTDVSGWRMPAVRSTCFVLHTGVPVVLPQRTYVLVLLISTLTRCTALPQHRNGQVSLDTAVIYN